MLLISLRLNFNFRLFLTATDIVFGNVDLNGASLLNNTISNVVNSVFPVFKLSSLIILNNLRLLNNFELVLFLVRVVLIFTLLLGLDLHDLIILFRFLRLHLFILPDTFNDATLLLVVALVVCWDQTGFN